MATAFKASDAADCRSPTLAAMEMSDEWNGDDPGDDGSVPPVELPALYDAAHAVRMDRDRQTPVADSKPPSHPSDPLLKRTWVQAASLGSLGREAAVPVRSSASMAPPLH